MNNQALDLIDIGLKLVACFYAVSSLYGVKRLAANFIMEQAIFSLGASDARETRAERERAYFLAGNLVLIGVGGVMLFFKLSVAAYVFMSALILYTLYLLVLAPRFWDPHDAPDAQGRSSTWSAYWAFLAATIFVVHAFWNGNLLSIAETPGTILSIPSALSLVLLIFGLRCIASMRMIPAAAHDNDGSELE